jgi:hypothetical protein
MQSLGSLLSIASRVEAAVDSYVSVRDMTDEKEWRAEFDRERVSAPLMVFQTHPRLL